MSHTHEWTAEEVAAFEAEMAAADAEDEAAFGCDDAEQEIHTERAERAARAAQVAAEIEDARLRPLQPGDPYPLPGWKQMPMGQRPQVDPEQVAAARQIALDTKGAEMPLPEDMAAIAKRVDDVFDEHEAEALAILARMQAEEWEGYDGDVIERKPRPKGLVSGGRFLFDVPDAMPSLWGDGKQVVHSCGEGMMLTGPQGVGKTSDAGQLAFGYAGVPGFETFYGMTVRPLPEGKRVLYLALDRPAQIARAHRRLIEPGHFDVIDRRILYLAGREMPFSTREMLAVPTRLAEWAVEQDAGVVFVDSLKDAIGSLSDEETAAAWNAVVQCLLDAGVEVVLLHHMRKSHALNKKPKTLDDVHGSGNLTRGLGSVVLLWGAAGDTEVELLHLKQPAEPVGPFVIQRDHDTGRSQVARDGVLPTGAKAERVRAVRAYFFSKGALVQVTRDEMIAAGLGSERTLDEALGVLVFDGVIDYTEGGGRGHPSTWCLRPLSTPSLPDA